MIRFEHDFRTRAVSNRFELFLRTGLLYPPDVDDIEVKYNPWHDAEDGRFTFAGAGRFFGLGSSPAKPGFGGGGSFGGAGSSASYPPPAPAKQPRSIARPTSSATSSASRSAITSGTSGGVIVQPIGGSATTHARLPSIGAQTRKPPETAGTTGDVIVSNGYAFRRDVEHRTRLASGTLTLAKRQVRSRVEQARAGKPDRLPADDGGHYIAARFNGPTGKFNHFAQDGNFNRGAYRVLEDEWANAVKAGEKVIVFITPVYEGSSVRPSEIKAHYIINGLDKYRRFSNRPVGR